jgi:hypothetical protein
VIFRKSDSLLLQNQDKLAFCTTIEPLLLPYVEKGLNEEWLSGFGYSINVESVALLQLFIRH